MDNKSEIQASSNHEPTDKDKKFWSMIRDADHKLRRKFGPSLSAWSPNPSNFHLLSSESYDQQLKEWGVKSDRKDSVGWCNFDNGEIAINTDGFENDLLNFRFYAAHEMIHAHTLTKYAGIDFNRLPKQYQEISEEQRQGYSHAALEVLIDLLAVRALKIDERDIDKLPLGLLVRSVSLLPYLEILAPFGNADQEILKMVRGEEPDELETKMSSLYGKDFYYGRFLPALLGYAASQRGSVSPQQVAKFSEFSMSTAIEAIAKKRKASYLSRPDVERAITISDQNFYTRII